MLHTYEHHGMALVRKLERIAADANAVTAAEGVIRPPDVVRHEVDKLNNLAIAVMTPDPRRYVKMCREALARYASIGVSALSDTFVMVVSLGEDSSEEFTVFGIQLAVSGFSKSASCN